MLPLPPLPPTDSFNVVRISSLTAALVKLNINIPIEELLKVIREIDKETREKEAAERRAILSELAHQPKSELTAEMYGHFDPADACIPNPPKPVNDDPLVWERRRRRLVAFAKEGFPGGEVPDEFKWAVDGANTDEEVEAIIYVEGS